MDTALLAAVVAPLGIYALAVPMPGPGFLVISRASIAHGTANGMAAALGTTASVVVYAVATALGVSVLLTTFPWFAGAIQIAGGAYLLWMGLVLLRATIAQRVGSAGMHGPAAKARESLRASFRRGLLVGLGNPKLAAFFLGLLAPAMGADLPIWARLVVVAGVIIIDLFYHQLLAIVVSKGRAVLGRAGRWFDAAVGGCLAAFGGALIIQAFRKL